VKNWDIKEHDFSGDNTMKNNQTRRTFFRNTCTAGILAASVGGITGTAYAASIGKKILADETMLEQYLKRFQKILMTFKKLEMEKISRAADMAAASFLTGGKLYQSLTGHIISGEISQTRIGNPKLFTGDMENMKAGDFLVTTRSSQANEAKKKGVKVVGFTTPFYRKEDTPPLGLENPGDIMLSDVCDITIKSYVPYTDGILYSDRIHIRPIPASGQMTIIFYWALVGGITFRLAQKGKYPVIAKSPG